MSKAFRERRVEKRYRALAAGKPLKHRFDILAPIGTVPHPVLGTIHAVSVDGKPSRSRVEVVELREGEFLADVWIETDPTRASARRMAPACLSSDSFFR